ncbi:XRE family transcriptional regulator [Xanthomonas oryzae pv. oryzae]|nr:XRE family transcriptional regulator [Xanthomonas oryzae pv. oryzae]
MRRGIHRRVEISRARGAAGLTQTEAAALVHSNIRSWQKWELGERRMHPAFWELFRLKLAAAGTKE